MIGDLVTHDADYQQYLDLEMWSAWQSLNCAMKKVQLEEEQDVVKCDWNRTTTSYYMMLLSFLAGKLLSRSRMCIKKNRKEAHPIMLSKDLFHSSVDTIKIEVDTFKGILNVGS